MKTRLKSTALLAALFVSGNVSAATTLISDNSLFEWVQTEYTTYGITWDYADNLAKTHTYEGTIDGSAQLATFDSVAQMNEIFENIEIKFGNQSSNWGDSDWSYGGWVGATATTKKDGTDTASWIDSDSTTVVDNDFFVINNSNPSGNGPGVSLAKAVIGGEAFYGLDDFGSNRSGTDGVYVTSYLVEYKLAPVPVPTAAFLFAPALVGFMAMRRKAAKKA